MASLAGVDCDGGPGPGAIYGYDYWSKRKGGSGCGLRSSRWVDVVAAESPATCLGEAAGRSSRSGGWRTPPVPRSPRTGSGWRCEAVQRVRGTGSAPGEVKRRPRDLPAAALLAERPAAARVCGRRVWGGLENQGRGALFVGRLGEAWACAPDKGGRRNPRRGLGLCCARRGEGDGADRRAPLVSGEARGAAERGERAGLRGWLAGPAGRRTERASWA